jgi:hypothetical protein
MSQQECDTFIYFNCDDDDDEVGGMNGLGRGNVQYSEKTSPDATYSTTNHT